jgi:phage baseplate assembly protein V
MFRDYGSAEKPDPTGFNVVRSGMVVDRRFGKNGPEVLIAYNDRGVTSDWLPVGNQGSAGATMFYCPRLNDNVTVLHYPTAIEQGIVVCTNPTKNGGSIQPDSINSVAMLADDGSQFSYNPDTKTLAIQGVGTITISASGDTSIQSNGNLNAIVGGNLSASANGSATVTAPTITLQGNVTITGNLTVQGVTSLQLASANPHCTNTDGSGGGT